MTEKGFPSDSPSKEVSSIDSGGTNPEERNTAWALLQENGFVKGEMNSFALSKQYTQIVDSYLHKGVTPAEALAMSDTMLR